MANIKSAKKRILVSELNAKRNKRIKNTLKETIRTFEDALAAEDIAKAKETFVLVEKKLMQTASKGTIHKNAASRKVSRLAARLNAAQK